MAGALEASEAFSTSGDLTGFVIGALGWASRKATLTRGTNTLDTFVALLA